MLVGDSVGVDLGRTASRGSGHHQGGRSGPPSLSYRNQSLFGLGRTFTGGLGKYFNDVSKYLDLLMDASGRLPEPQKTEAITKLREANSYMVNQIIIPSDRITDSEVTKYLNNVADLLSYVRKDLFDKTKTPVEALPLVPSDSGKAVVATDELKELVVKYNDAFDVHPSLRDRWAKIGAPLKALMQVPFFGPMVAPTVSAVESKLKFADGNINSANDAMKIIKYESEIVRPTNRATIDQKTWQLPRSWVNAVYSADEQIKRLEAQAVKKPAPEAVAPPSITYAGQEGTKKGLWIGLAAVGAIAIGFGIYQMTKKPAPSGI
jgi:hypothetical protein